MTVTNSVRVIQSEWQTVAVWHLLLVGLCLYDSVRVKKT